MAEIHHLRRFGFFRGKTIPSAERTVIENCQAEHAGEPHVHLYGFSTQADKSVEYEMVLGEDIVRHIVAVFREQGCDV